LQVDDTTVYVKGKIYGVIENKLKPTLFFENSSRPKIKYTLILEIIL
jgi:hypothetical protein